MASKERRVIYVRTDGVDTRAGRSRANAVLTLTAAHALVSSGRGDIIDIGPGTFTPVNITKDYVTLRASIEDSGYAKPDLIAAANGPTISGQGVVLRGLRLVGEAGYGVRLQGNGGLLQGCALQGTTDAIQLLPDNTNDAKTASEWQIRENLISDSAQGIRFKNPGPTGAPPTGGIGPTYTRILDNVFVAITNEDLIDEDTAGSNDKTFWDCVAHGNRHLDRNKAVYVTLTNGAANRGMVHGYFADDGGLDGTKIAIATAIVFLGQQAAGIVNGSGF